MPAIRNGERADEAVHREFMEELGVRLDSATRIGVYDNIFTYEGSPVRWVPIEDIRRGVRPLFPSGATEALFTLAG